MGYIFHFQVYQYEPDKQTVCAKDGASERTWTTCRDALVSREDREVRSDRIYSVSVFCSC